MASFLLIRKEVSSLPTVEKERLQSLPNVGMAPMLTEYIGWIQTALDMGETKNLGSNGFTNAMVRECVVSLGELGVWGSSTDNNQLVVSEHVRLSLERNSEVSESQS